MNDIAVRRPAKLRAKEAASRLADKYVDKDGGAPAPTSPNLPAVTSTARGGWAGRIAEAYRGGAEAFIETGRLLIEAKAALDHGEYEDMVKRDLPFSPSTARKLVAIARDTRIANRSTVERLPPAWTILYEITKLDDQTFNAMLAEGSINPGMTKLVADSAVWLEKHRKGARLKRLPKKLAKAPPKKAKDAAPPRRQPLSPETAKDLHAFVTELANYMRDAPPNVASSVLFLPPDERRELAECASAAVAWLSRIYEAASPKKGTDI